MVSICRRFEFHAAHHLPFHQGKCKNIHGHSYFLEVEVSGDIQKKGPASGMVTDFGILKEIVNTHVVELLDHQDLNKIWMTPTAEAMVQDIAVWLEPPLEKFNLSIERVRLYETSNSYAEWRNKK